MLFREVLEKVKSIINECDIDLDLEGEKQKRLIESGKSVYEELLTEYTNLKMTEEVELISNIFFFNDLSKKVKDILNITQNGKSYDFEMYPLYVKCSAKGKVVIKYYYLPEEPDLDTELLLPPKFTLYMLANGIASEYFYRGGLVDAASYYRHKFDYSLSNISTRQRNLSIKADKFVC